MTQHAETKETYQRICYHLLSRLVGAVAPRMPIFVSGAGLPLWKKDDFTTTGRNILEKYGNSLFYATLSILSATLVLNFTYTHLKNQLCEVLFTIISPSRHGFETLGNGLSGRKMKQ